MKKREFLIANLTLGAVVLVTALTTFNLMTNQNARALVGESIIPAKNLNVIPAETRGTCSTKTALVLSTSYKESHLAKLAAYQEACRSFTTDTLMIFTSFPHDEASAEELSTSLAVQLKLFSQNHIRPIVVAEPYTEIGMVSYRSFIQGTYDTALTSFFSKLKSKGITDEMAGTWVPFPESNTPSWDNKDTDPSDFALVVNKYLRSFKHNFPLGKGSVLLSATTYDPNDLEWANGDYLSFIPYVQELDKTLIDSFGIQGFPWASSANIERKRQIFRANEFLQPDLAISAAQELHTRDIWINTGSFGRKYTLNDSESIQVSLNDRKAILAGILETAAQIQNYQLNAYRVSINLFAEDKSKEAEATDWSYLANEDSTTLFRDFMFKAEEQGIPVSLFDKQAD